MYSRATGTLFEQVLKYFWERCRGAERMNVLVTGGTGFIGSALVEALAGRGHDLYVLSRNPDRARARLPATARAVAWEPLAGPPPHEALDGVDVVFNLAGEPPNGRS
jgi:nucleoside-diphosphate-sugar epimerase